MSNSTNSRLFNIKLSSFGKVIVRFASAQIVSNSLRLISGFLVVRFIEPELYGQFSGIGIYMGYILLGHGGIINGLGRELPYELGRKNDTYARELASSVYVLSVIICIIASLLFLTFGIKKFIDSNTTTALIYLAYTVIGGLYLLNKQFLPTLYRTNKDFDSLSKQNILVGLANLLTIVLVYFFSIYGLIARGVFLALWEFFLLYKNKPYKLTFSYHVNHFKILFKTGIPIFMVGYVNVLWQTVMNNIIFSAGGALMYGFYALSSILQGAVGVIPASFGQVIYPRMSIMFGEGKTISYILKANIKPLFFQFAIMSGISVAGAFLLPIIIPLILPKYTGGILAAQWMLFVPVAQSFGALNNIYNVIKKQQWYFVSLLTGAIVGSLFVYFKVQLGDFQLEYFPQGILLGTIIQQLLSLLFLSTLKKFE